MTGTASGAMGAYYARYMRQDEPDDIQLIVEQGQEIGRDGRVHVRVREGDVVEITGQAVFVGNIEANIGDK